MCCFSVLESVTFCFGAECFDFADSIWDWRPGEEARSAFLSSGEVEFGEAGLVGTGFVVFVACLRASLM